MRIFSNSNVVMSVNAYLIYYTVINSDFSRWIFSLAKFSYLAEAI